MSGDFCIHLICPYCQRWKWVHLHEPGLTRGQILNSLCVFNCPVHGLLLEKPLQAHERRIALRKYHPAWLIELIDG